MDEITCGIFLIHRTEGNFLLCKPTGNNYLLSIPKGLIDEKEFSEEIAKNTAIRELEEEAGVKLQQEQITYLGEKKYKKRLKKLKAYYSFIDSYPEKLFCESYFICKNDDVLKKEIESYSWHNLNDTTIESKMHETQIKFLNELRVIWNELKK